MIVGWSLRALGALVAAAGVGCLVLAYDIQTGDAAVPSGMDLAPLSIAVAAGAILLLRRRWTPAYQWVRRGLYAIILLAIFALLHPLGAALVALFNAHDEFGRYAILLVLSLGTVGVAAMLLGAAITLFAASRANDRARADLEAFD